MRLLARTLLLAGAVIAATPSAVAQTWPQRQVKFITPLPPGTGIDLAARIYAELMAKRWGQPVIVENRVGAEGIVAVGSLVAARDDHTLLVSIGAPLTIAPLTTDKLPYDPVADVIPIAQISEQFLAFGASNAFAANTLAEVEAFARREPGKLIWGANTGLPHLSFSTFVRKAGLDTANPTYRDTASPMTDLAEGRLHVFVTGMATMQGLARAGKLRYLAVLGRERFPVAPDVPTVVEAGYPHMAVSGFLGLFGAKGISTELRDTILADLKAATSSDPALPKRFLDAALSMRVEPAAELVRLLDEQRTMVAEALRLAGGKPAR